MTAQILLGSMMLTLCALVDVALMTTSLPIITRVAVALQNKALGVRNAFVLCVGVLAIVLAHTVQIWSWALVFRVLGVLEDFQTSFYFATVTYTTLGYGDVVLGDGLRIFATFAAITGLLTFGISTAFLIAMVTRLLPSEIGLTK